MNPWQIVRQFQYLLRAKTWPSVATKVFHAQSVKIIEEGQEDVALDENLILPLCILSPGFGQTDPVGRGTEGALVERELGITLVTANQGDRIGEAAVVGGMRTGATDSRGRGVLELETPVLACLNALTATNGIVIASVGTGAPATRKMNETWIAIQGYQFKVYCTTEKFYAPPRKLVAVSRTGQVDLTWENPPDRWDRYRVRLVRKAGSTAPTSISDGTVVALPSNLPTSFSNTGLAPGTYSYGLFASYSEFDATTQVDDAYSDPATAAGAQAF